MPVLIAAVVLGVVVLAVLLVKRGAKSTRAHEVSQLRARYPEDIAFMEDVQGINVSEQLEYVKALLYMQEKVGVSFRKLYSENDEMALSFWMGVGRAYSKDRNHAKAAECLEKALAIAMKDGGQKPERVAELRCELGVTLNELGEHNRAIDLFEKSLAYHRENGQMECREAAILLHNIGWAWQGKGNEVQARAHYEQALALCEKIGLAEGIQIVSEKMQKLRSNKQDSAS